MFVKVNILNDNRAQKTTLISTEQLFLKLSKLYEVENSTSQGGIRTHNHSIQKGEMVARWKIVSFEITYFVIHVCT